VAPQPGD